MHPRELGMLLTCALAVTACSTERPSSVTGLEIVMETTVPATTASSVPFASVSVGSGISCGLTAEGAAVCWGPGDPPATVSGGPSFVSVSAGEDYACALEGDGTAYCWGDNFRGRLGDGTEEDQLVPTRVSSDQSFSSVTAGTFSTCAIGQGDVWCWGQWGTPEPQRVTQGHQFVSVALGSGHGCALDEDGAAHCWGDNSWGQLGDGTTTTRDDVRPVVTSLRFASIHAGSSFVCGLTASGEAHCWGHNDLTLELGVGDAALELSTEPLAVSGGHTFRTLTTGYTHACGIDAAGATWCWGDGDFGELGDGRAMVSGVPSLVLGGHGFARIDAGEWATCGLLPDGTPYCWGAGVTGNQVVPTALQGRTGSGVVSAGAVGDLVAHRPTTSTMRLSWREVDDGTGLPAWYRVKYAESPLRDWRNATIGCDRTLVGREIGADTGCLVEGLEPGTKYDFQLMSFRVVDGRWVGATYSNIAVGTTRTGAADVPTVVQDLEVIGATSTSLTLEWTQVDDGLGAPAWYRVRYGSPLGVWSAGTIGCDRSLAGTEIGAPLTCTVEGLEPGVTYELQLYSYRIEDGKWAGAKPSNRTVGTTSVGS